MAADATLRPDELRERVFARLATLDGLSLLEQYAMFMGKAQLVELAMKRMLIERFMRPESALEKLTLGMVTIYRSHSPQRRASAALLPPHPPFSDLRRV